MRADPVTAGDFKKGDRNPAGGVPEKTGQILMVSLDARAGFALKTGLMVYLRAWGGKGLCMGKDRKLRRRKKFPGRDADLTGLIP